MDPSLNDVERVADFVRHLVREPRSCERFLSLHKLLLRRFQISEGFFELLLALREFGIALLQRIFESLLRGEVLRDPARADDLPRALRSGIFVVMHPADAAVGQRFFFDLPDDRLAGAHHFLLVGKRRLGVLAREEIEVRFSDRLERDW